MPATENLTLPWHVQHESWQGGYTYHVSIDNATLVENLRQCGCSMLYLGDTHNRIDSIVSVCKHGVVCAQFGLEHAPHRHDEPEDLMKEDATPRIAMCIPPLYGKLLSQNANVLDHHAYHSRLGISWLFLYTTAPLVGAWMLPENSTLLHMPWVNSMKIWQRGQAWQINDCIHRAGTRGFTWTLNIDTDEYLVLGPKFATLFDIVIPAPKTAPLHRAVDAVDFGMRFADTLNDSASRPIFCRSHSKFMDLDYVSETPHLCVNFWGRRKHLLRTRTVLTAGIHAVQRCGAPCAPEARCRVHHFDARYSWIAHLRKRTASWAYKDMPGL